MKKYRIKSEDEVFEMSCDHVEINNDGHLELYIDDVREACFTEWDYFYRVIPKDVEELSLEEIKRYYQGFSYVPPKERERRATAVLVDALKELQDAVNAQ